SFLYTLACVFPMERIPITPTRSFLSLILEVLQSRSRQGVREQGPLRLCTSTVPGTRRTRPAQLNQANFPVGTRRRFHSGSAANSQADCRRLEASSRPRVSGPLHQCSRQP